VWGETIGTITDKPDDEWLMIEAGHLEVQPLEAAVKGNLQMSWTKGSSTLNEIWPGIRMVGRSKRLLPKAQPQITLQLKI